jgi:hypothetical protein
MHGKPTKRSRTKNQTSEIDEFLIEKNRTANELRSKIAEFHGLERELTQAQDQMLVDYERTRPLKNPRERGDAREGILRGFLLKSGLFPERYGVSKFRARVVSPSGHCSNELDIVFFDRLETVLLMRRNEVAEVYPRDCVFGTIQVKSSVNKIEIGSAFKNLASFKRLYDSNGPFSGSWAGQRPSNKGFGILFSFESDLEWEGLTETIEACAREYPVAHLPNAIVILNKGVILFSQDLEPRWHNDDIAKMSEPAPYSLPNQGGNCLWNFYNISMDLLRSTSTSRPNIGEYFRLPLTTGKLSYYFVHGVFDEIGKCPKHGEFLRTISPENLTKIVDFCNEAESINWIKALDIARGKPGDDNEAYARQPLDVKIFNPDDLPFKELLVTPEGNLTVDDIVLGNVHVWIPYFYTERDGVIGSCPKCSKRSRRAKPG